ncbi:acetyl-CoA carboxylase carboxyltransferase subunit alpha [Alphaproteobacteria bacterium]|nr:acetyl-CoA carboxylase carboxyltransferase subunit alpha [Alphaproteobacteria bacterium]MDB3974376.1 acetyl-CoA carboxylase carboxyltransferase subunit alpha [Alphaproteobacteria bacterium]
MFYLDFEEKLEKLDTEKKTLLKLSDENGLDVSSKVSAIEKKEKDELEKIYSNLSPWQIVKIARHPNRPKTKAYINNIFSNFTSLFGDRLYSEDSAIISGFAFLEGKPVLILGTEKGNDMNSRIQHNFGMAKPEGYRKSQRIMKLASKLNIPLICFIDTSGAYPGKDAEERGQAEAIAQSMKVALNCGAPCISVIIGEGGSGGAIALGTSDKVLMLSNSIYSVISPEGCSSILWKSSEYAEIASNSLRITASDCLKFNIIDEIIEEPIGGAHRDHNYIGESLKKSLLDNLNNLRKKDIDDLIASRNERYLNYLP